MLEVTCAIVLKDDLVLVAQRSESMKMPLKWEFPGGKVEAGESEEDCLRRELKEELNIEVEIVGKLERHHYAYPEFDITLVPFIARYRSGEIHLLEHKSFLWLEQDALPNLDWAEADIPVLNAFLLARGRLGS